MEVFFWCIFGLIIYAYLGYPLVLGVIHYIKCNLEICCDLSKKTTLKDFLPRISVIIAAYNEEKNIENRIQNILKQDYILDNIEIIVASDGSTDKTVEIAKKYEKHNVKVLDFRENIGRATVHNNAVDIAKGEILIFTDAETIFEKDFIKEIIAPFYKKDVGCAIGNLKYVSNTNKSVQISEGIYFKFEKFIRKLESDLCILSTGTGACMGVRKNLWENLLPTDDVDFATPLDVIRKGYKVIYVPTAIAYDLPFLSLKREFFARIRQTSKNFFGTLKRFKGLPFTIKLALFSHKLIRWFTFPILILVLFLNIYLVTDYQKNLLYITLLYGQFLFYLSALIGLILHIFSKYIFPFNFFYVFLIATVGMFIGILKSLFGIIPEKYNKES